MITDKQVEAALVALSGNEDWRNDDWVGANSAEYVFNDMRAALEAAEAAAWEPIETAPKDGTYILLWRPGFRQETAHWLADMIGFDWPWLLPLPGEDRMRLKPTHWRPLPEPPKEDKQ